MLKMHKFMHAMSSVYCVHQIYITIWKISVLLCPGFRAKLQSQLYKCYKELIPLACRRSVPAPMFNMFAFCLQKHSCNVQCVLCVADMHYLMWDICSIVSRIQGLPTTTIIKMIMIYFWHLDGPYRPLFQILASVCTHMHVMFIIRLIMSKVSVARTPAPAGYMKI